MSYVPPKPGQLGPTNGPFVIGISLSCVLTGMLITQTWNYFARNERDGLILRIGVALACLLNVVSTGLDLQIVWNMAVADFGNFEGLKATPPTHLWSIFLCSFVLGISQAFFGHRSWKAVNKNIPLGILFAGMVTLSFGSNFASPLTHLANAPKHVVRTVASVWLWSSAVTDVIISSVLLWKLWNSRREPDLMQRTQSLLDSLLVLVLGTASVTASAAMIDAIFLSISPLNTTTNTHSALTILLPRLYGNTFVYTLNHRQQLRDNQTYSQSNSRTYGRGRKGSGSGVSGISHSHPGAPHAKEIVVTRISEIQQADPNDYDLENMGYKEGYHKEAPRSMLKNSSVHYGNQHFGSPGLGSLDSDRDLKH